MLVGGTIDAQKNPIIPEKKTALKRRPPRSAKALLFRVTSLIFPVTLFADQQTFAALKTMLLKIRFDFCCPARAKIDALKQSFVPKTVRLTG